VNVPQPHRLLSDAAVASPYATVHIAAISRWQGPTLAEILGTPI